MVLEGFVILRKWVLVFLHKFLKADFDDIFYRLVVIIEDPTFLNLVCVVLIKAFHQCVDVVSQVCRCMLHSLVGTEDVIETF